MNFRIGGEEITLDAGENLTGKEGYLVTVKGGSADMEALLTDDELEPIVGVLTRGGASGTPVKVQISGVANVKCNGAITRGDLVKSATGGDEGKGAKFVLGTDGHDHGATPADAAAQADSFTHVLGTALATAADEDQIPVAIQPQTF